ncbi:uncharacterized protein LOC133805549 [Humulus lupulus]|uniref:uncharacterized protein LOC133805549 n=1 Tax=Humulus lupulus TaxID=3486 RepID=UPI002B40FB62|nr:uncharacterized protein LOC133805549 [Humulus lupulus]
MEIWVQVYNLKVGFMSDRVLKACGGFIGMFISSCPKNYAGIWREFLRVRVRINIEQPLKRRMKIQYSKRDFFWAEFKYERLPTFCFICGVLGHSEKFCIKLFEEEPENIVRPYGLFMRAPDRRQGKQIGARWLCDNMARPFTGNHEGSSSAVTTNAGGVNERIIRDTQMREAGMRGVNYGNEGVTPGRMRGVDTDLIYRDRGEVNGGIRGIEKDSGCRVEGGINGVIVDQITDVNEEGIGYQNEGFLFLDPKRRRVNLGLEHGLRVGRTEAMELGRDEEVGERARAGLEIRAKLQTQTKEAVLDPISEDGGQNSEVDKVDVIKWKLGFEGSFVVDAHGHSGGLVMLWRKEEEGRLMSYSFNHIDIVLKLENHPEFRLTGFYGEPQRRLRHNTWRRLTQLAGASELPWCLIGDLNNVLYQWEKRGGHAYPSGLINGFQDTLVDCGLSDMELIGHPYTWERGRGTPNWIEVRLDRALISQSWRSIFSAAKLVNLEISASDHSPLWLDLAYQKRDPYVKRFRFENAWVREPMCRQIIQDNWVAYSTDTLQNKIKCCSTALAEWGKDITGNFKERISQCNRVLRQLKGRRDDESVRRYQEIHSCLFEVLTQKEIFWRQRSKQLWIQAGDQNTKFFHACASTRKRANQLTSLKNDHGMWVDWDNGLGNVIVDYFRNIFSASTTDWDRVTECVPESITEEINLELLAPVEEGEAKEALFQMHPDKSPGPDGFNPGFYQKFWDIVGPDVVRLVQHFFMFTEFPDHLNDTHIVLIPKKSKPETMGDLRPIALCNVVYKLSRKLWAIV